MNQVIMTGRMATDPEQKATGSGTAMTTFRLAVKRIKRQEGQPEADFFRIVCFGKTANNVAEYCVKGREVGVIGKIQNGSYKIKDGETRYTTDIIADNVEFYGGRSEKPKQEYQGFSEYEDDDDSIPF